MKKIFLILLLFPLFGFSQKLNGFAKIRLFANETELIPELLSDLKCKLKVVDKPYEKRNDERIDYNENNSSDPPQIYNIKIKYSLHDWPVSIITNNAQFLSDNIDSFDIYFINHIFLGNIDIQSIYLTFYKGKLSLIETDFSHEFLSAAKEKYQPSYTLDTTSKIKCRYKFTGTENEFEEGTHICKWEYPESQSEISIMSKYSPECEMEVTDYMIFITKDMALKINKLKLDDEKKREYEKNKNSKSIKDNI